MNEQQPAAQSPESTMSQAVECCAETNPPAEARPEAQVEGEVGAASGETFVEDAVEVEDAEEVEFVTLSELDELDAASPDAERHRKLVSALADLTQQIERREHELQSRLSALEQSANALRMDQAERDEQRKVRETLHEKVQNAKSIYKFQILQPFVQRLASLHDLISDFDRAPTEDPRVWRESLKLLKRHMEQTLEDQGMNAIRPSPGDAFDARWHHIVDTAQTEDAQADGRIKDVTQIGFLYFAQNDRTGDLRPTVVRPARIVTWKYNPSLSPATTEESPPPGASEPPATGDTQDAPSDD